MKTVEKLKKYLEEIKKNDQNGKKINAILQLNPNINEEARKIDEKISKKKAGKLAGQIIVLKANINIEGMNISCGSKVLENYKAPYDATVVKKIKDEDGLILGLTNCDEFACGWSGETSAFGPTKNPINIELVAGGSSSGSGAAVAANFCDMALGSDTGGSIRVPASHCGVVGVKPSYGFVSRYGLIDMCMSFDQIGPLTKNVQDAALLLSVIQGYDECDSISEESKSINLKKVEEIPKKIVVGLLDFEISNKEIQKLIDDKTKQFCKKYNWELKKINIPHLDLAIATYFPIVYTEFYSATRRLDGRRYGKKVEEACGPEVLRRILGGSEITKAEHQGRNYHLALQARELLKKEFEKIFKEVDCIISPVVPRLPHKIGEKISSKEMFEYDALTSPMNIVGNCALSLPIGEINKIPVGMQIACDKFQDEKMLQIARSIEKLQIS